MIIPKHLVMLGLDDNNHALIAYCRMHGIKGKIYTHTDSGSDFKVSMNETLSICVGYLSGCYDEKYLNENRVVIPSEGSIKIYNRAIEEENAR